HTYFDHTFSWFVPLLGKFEARIPISNGTFIAMACCGLAVLLLYRRISVIGKLSKLLWGGLSARWSGSFLPEFHPSDGAGPLIFPGGGSVPPPAFSWD